MINIDVVDLTNKLPINNLPDMEKVKGITIHCLPEYFTYEETTAYTNSGLSIANKLSEKTGYHYVIDANSIYQYVPDKKQIPHVIDGKPTFISKALYDGKPNEQSIAILIAIPKLQQYEEIERKAIKFIAKYLVSNELTVDNIMRGFDLNKLPTPLHLLEQTKWRRLILRIKNAYTAMKAEGYNEEEADKVIETATTTYKDKEVRDFYIENGENASVYAEKFQPDHRDIAAIVNYKSNEKGELKSFTTKHNTTFTYSVVENSPGSSDHCTRAFDTLSSKANPNSLEVEPIYPDIIVPPGEKLTIVSGVTKSTSIDNNKMALSIEELEKREKVFNIKDYKDAVKEVNGRPINNNDPYPVDDKIRELESHIPKIKIDEVNFNLHDCNHPGSVIGPEVAKNFAMIQDEIITMAKRTEKRIVKLENIMSTLMRNLFRVSSRMHINCCYYGGQDIYSKYKNIRCLHNDRINDGQSMTLDQCLSCTRYEPILGQVYAILDETNTNVSQVLDDLQMGYMSMDEYIKLTRIEEVQTEKQFADFKVDTPVPTPFSETFDEGFKMDWNNTVLETQKPNVAKYNIEGIEAKKVSLKKENEGYVEPEFKDAIEEFEASENLQYNSDDYVFNEFGSNYDGVTAGGLYGGYADARNKIIEYAENALKLCQEGKAGYSQDYRYKHLEAAINGVSYWDCSSLVEKAYASAGIDNIGTNTYTQYPFCLPGAGGKIILKANETEAKPGDTVWFTDQSPLPSSEQECISATIGQIYHVGIYVGNGEYIHASTSNAPLTQQIKKSKVNGAHKLFAFGRPKALIEADEKAATINALGEGFFMSLEQHEFSEEMIRKANKYAESQVQSTIDSINKYGYKQHLIEAAKKINIDPYIVLGLIATESAGDPTNRTGGYWGLMQTPKEHTKATTNLEDIKHDIDLGCNHIVEKQKAIGSQMAKNIAMPLWAYNAGQLIPINANKLQGGTIELLPLGKAEPFISQAGFNYYQTEAKREEIGTYVPKIIARARLFKQKNILG